MHGFRSSQSVPEVSTPEQRLSIQTSPVVQALLSSHCLAFAVFVQPDSGMQESSVQTFSSSQVRASPPGWHSPAKQ